VPDGEKPNGEKSPAGRKADPIARVTEILGVVAGSAALVYVTGGAIYLARLAFYDVPALTVVSSLPREFLISVGLLALGIPALVGACLYICLARWLYESKDRWFLAPWLLVAVTVCLAVVYVLIEADSSPSPQVVAGIMVVATILFAAIALLGTVINRYWEKDALWHRGCPLRVRSCSGGTYAKRRATASKSRGMRGKVRFHHGSVPRAERRTRVAR